ncbi:MAG: hypothetical protein JNK56_14040 [Myxococcales bacterium]|nr:hypothetical protein [Myxococcales bacterium]
MLAPPVGSEPWLVGVDPPDVLADPLAPVSLPAPPVLLLPASPHAARTTASAHPTRRSTTMTRTLLRGRRADKRRPPTDAIARAPHSSAEYGGAG